MKVTKLVVKIRDIPAVRTMPLPPADTNKTLDEVVKDFDGEMSNPFSIFEYVIIYCGDNVEYLISNGDL